MTRIRITQTRSRIGHPQKIRETITALGLGRPRRSVIHEDTPQIRGMIRKVQHLVEVEEVE